MFYGIYKPNYSLPSKKNVIYGSTNTEKEYNDDRNLQFDDNDVHNEFIMWYIVIFENTYDW